MPKPLEGVFVLDLTRVLAGPFCTMILADLGATVVKVERPGKGDDSRAFSPMIGEESAYFMSINRGKKSITLNLKDERGKELLLELVEKADVVVENFRPGVMEKLGLSYEELQKTNPSLIYASSSGYGHSGPYSKKAAYDLIIQGLSGMMSITGPDIDHPMKVGSSLADIISGMFTCIGILSSLLHKSRGGEAQRVDVAMLDSMVAVLENAIVRYTVTGEIPRPIGNLHPSIAPFASFETRDGRINIAIGNDSLWEKFCTVLEQADWLEDPRFTTNPLRVKNLEPLMALINKRLAQKDSEEWLSIFEQHDIPSGQVNRMNQVLSHPQLKAREMLVDVEHPAGTVTMPGVPIKFSQTPASISGPAPRLGQDNHEVYVGWLKLSEERFTQLQQEGVI